MKAMVISIFLVAGAILSMVSAVGIHRLKDPYTRLHATSTINSLGLICFLVASLFYTLESPAAYNVRQLLTILFLFTTVPAGVHILSRSAIVRDVAMWKLDGDLSDRERAIIRTIKEQSAARRALRSRNQRQSEGQGERTQPVSHFSGER